MARKVKIDYAELCDVLRIKVNAARAQGAESAVKAGKALTEPQTAVAGSGSQMGDPRAGEARRLAEIDGAFQRGTVKVPVKGDKGRTKLEERPGTEDNVRAALAYWKSRRPRTDASRAAQSENVSALTRRLDAMGAHKTPAYVPGATPWTGRYVTEQHAPGTQAMVADQSPEGRTPFALAGPALVQGPNVDARKGRPTWRNPKTGEIEPAAARLDGSLTERLDRTVADERPKARRSASQRKNWRRKQQRNALQARVTELETLLGQK